jgi:hypothetical protein
LRGRASSALEAKARERIVFASAACFVFPRRGSLQLVVHSSFLRFSFFLPLSSHFIAFASYNTSKTQRKWNKIARDKGWLSKTKWAEILSSATGSLIRSHHSLLDRRRSFVFFGWLLWLSMLTADVRTPRFQKAASVVFLCTNGRLDTTKLITVLYTVCFMPCLFA